MKKTKKGFSLIELLVAIGILSSLFSVLVLIINPMELKKKARDSRRLADITNLAIAIESYKLKNGVYPDTKDTTRISTTPVAPSTDVYKSTGGWIGTDLSDYLDKMYADPLNNSTYNYTYRHTDNDYELNAVLEYYTEKLTDDGGDNSSKYEVGTDLTILN